MREIVHSLYEGKDKRVYLEYRKPPTHITHNNPESKEFVYSSIDMFHDER